MKITPWLVCAGCLLGAAAHAEDEDQGVESQYQITGSLAGDFNARSDWRLAETAYFDGDKKLYASATQITLGWAALRWLTLNGAYRVSQVDEDGATWIRHRVVAAGAARLPLGHWGWSYRLSWQNDWRDPDEGGTRYRAYLRNQGQVRYSGFKRFAPYFAVEVWYRVDENKTTSGVDRTRYTLGGDLAVTKRQTLGMFIRNQVYGNGDPDLHVGSLEYGYSFD